jgi:hypothetical protein
MNMIKLLALVQFITELFNASNTNEEVIERGAGY